MIMLLKRKYFILNTIVYFNTILLSFLLIVPMSCFASWTMPVVQPKYKTKQFAFMILVSFSMPISSIRRYVLDSQRIGGTVVLRGLVNNSLSTTVRRLHDVIQGIRGGLAIDPIVFEKLSVTNVPAIVLFNTKGVACLRQPHCVPSDNVFDIVYGNVTLAYALTLMANHENAIAPLAKRLLLTLRRRDDVATR